MDDAFRIREARAEDAAEIARLTTQLAGASADAVLAPQTLARRLDRILEHPMHAVFVAAAEDALRGFVAAEHRLLLQFGERIELIALVTDADVRRQGVGRALVAATERWATRRGVTEMVVRSSLNRDAAHPFYRGLGYAHRKTQHVYTRMLTP